MRRLSLDPDHLTGRWWFYLLILLLGFVLLPPYAQESYRPWEMGRMVMETLGNAVIDGLVDMRWPAALLHIVALLILLGIALKGEAAEGAFNLYSCLTYYMIAIGQGVGYTERYGLVILTGNIVVVLLVATLWAWECRVHRNQFRGPVERARLWVLPLALWAFWSPAKPGLDPSYLLFGYYGVAYCLTTPVLLTPLILHYPNVNRPVMRVTAFIGLIFAILNVLSPLYGGDLWQGPILHLPLLLTCFYALLLSRR